MTPTAAGALLEQLPPRSEEAEAATLGAMLLSPLMMIPELRATVRPGDFYSEANRSLCSTLFQMFDEETRVDIVTVTNKLRSRDLLDAVGGQSYLAHLLDAVPTAASGKHYALIVKEKARLREIRLLAQRTLDESTDGAKSADVIAALRAALDELAESEAVETFAAIRCCDFVTTTLPSPLWVCEPLVPGGGISFLFSRAGLGKSLLSFELARCVARGEPFLGQFKTTSGPTIYFNLEMAVPQFQERLRRFEHYHPVGDAALHVVNEPLALNDPASFARFKALCENIGPALVVVDPLVRTLPGTDENSATEINQALSPAADLARELGFGLLCDHHSTKGDARQGLDSLAGSRDFAARADVALLLQSLDNEGSVGGEGLLRVTCVKSRWGERPTPFCFRVETDREGFPSIIAADAPSACDDILALFEMQRPLAAKQISSELEGMWSRFQVNRGLQALLGDGRLIRPSRGVYDLPNGGENR